MSWQDVLHGVNLLPSRLPMQPSQLLCSMITASLTTPNCCYIEFYSFVVTVASVCLSPARAFILNSNLRGQRAYTSIKRHLGCFFFFLFRHMVKQFLAWLESIYFLLCSELRFFFFNLYRYCDTNVKQYDCGALRSQPHPEHNTRQSLYIVGGGQKHEAPVRKQSCGSVGGLLN